MTWHSGDTLLVGAISGAVASVSAHYLLQWLGHRKARRDLICRRIDAAEERTCEWLQTMPRADQQTDHAAVQRRLFEIALTRLERVLDDSQKRALVTNCLNLRNLRMTQQARTELEQLLQNLDALHRSLDKR